ncbi:hypothetical protein PQR34_14500 [Paraburkholderia sediminicola]|uniref:hypothetical protein n=1 Tax=Paraburkholderia sediminicola TaxID=458836 RepID=UPI0038B9F305
MEYVPHHVWTGNTVSLACKRRYRGQLVQRKVVIDFDRLGIARGGLLDACLTDAPVPINSSNANVFQRALKGVAPVADLNRILSTPPELLSPWELEHLLTGFEDEIEKWAKRTRATVSNQARSLFRTCKYLLADGTRVSDFVFTTRFTAPTRIGTLPLAEDFIDVFSTKELAEPLSAINAETKTGLDRKAVKHLQMRLDRVLTICDSVIDRYEKLRETLRLVEQTPPPVALSKIQLRNLQRGSYPTYRQRRKLDADTRLWIAVYIAKRDDLSHSYPSRYFNLQGIPILQSLENRKNEKGAFEALLCRTYAPRCVLLAFLIIIQASLIWNTDTAISLSKNRIRVYRNRIEVWGLKHKTAKKQNGIVRKPPIEQESDGEEIGWNEINEQRAIRAIKLLLEHDRAVTSHGVRENDSIFSGLRLKQMNPLSFQVPHLARNLRGFIKSHSLPAFTLDDIRTHAANIFFLERGRDIHALSVVMGHANLAITEQYLNTTLVRLLNAANMKRYMDILAPTIVFVCRGRSAVEALKLDATRIDDNLLFPVSSMADEDGDSLADQWIASNGELKLKIGANEIQHCALQIIFYRENLRGLVADNISRFKAFHLPRLVFCVALYTFIKASRYAFILEQCEEVLNAP